MHTSNSYNRVVAITTFNMDKRWKEHILSLLPDKIEYCLDLACGTGILSKMLNTKVANVIGLDLIYASLAIAKGNVVQGAAEYLPFRDESMDAIVSSYLPKYCEPKLTIRECARVLKRNGILIMHDFTYPSGIVRFFWHLYFKILRFIGIFTPTWRDVFNELDSVIKESNWVEELKREMEENGFIDIGYLSLTMHTSAILYGRKMRPS